MRIKIIEVPPGEAPESVRHAWVGLILPQAVPGDDAGYGVLSRQPARGFLGWLWDLFEGRRTTHYAVPVEAAVAILEQSDPKAAAWWRTNTPYLFGTGDRFAFIADVCEVLAEPSTAEDVA